MSVFFYIFKCIKKILITEIVHVKLCSLTLEGCGFWSSLVLVLKLIEDGMQVKKCCYVLVIKQEMKKLEKVLQNFLFCQTIKYSSFRTF